MIKFISTFILVFGLVIGVSAIFQATKAEAKSFPECTDNRVLKRISSRFNAAENRTWHRGLYVDSIFRPHGHGHHGFDESFIDRRYCHAYANLSNGVTRKVHYLIEDGQGFAGIGWNVEFCVTGLDPWKVYDGYCRTVRP